MIQIFGTKKCKATQKALRYFKERNIKYQFIDLNVKGMSQGELNNVLQFYNIDDIIDINSKEYTAKNLKYINHDKVQAVLDYPLIMKTPVLRENKKVQLGFEGSCKV
jgi:arsenate reductase-like glutaredoxin family protein